MDFTGDWLKAFGRPSYRDAWIIWGASGSGKTRFTLQLCKYLTQFGRVAYNSLEEGDSLSLQQGFEDVNMMEVSGRLVLLDRMSMEELSEKLSKRKSWDIIVIDSFQYTGMTYKDYQKLRERHPDKLFIFISHAKGNDPAGGPASKVRYDCGCKIRVEGFRAIVTSRYMKGAGKPYTIWEEGAALYWGNFNNNQNTED